MKSALLFSAIALCMTAQAQADSLAAPMFDSKYSSIEEKDCVQVGSSATDPDAEGDYFMSTCPGQDGLTVKFEGGDARSWFGVIRTGEAYEDGPSFDGPVLSGALGYFPNVQGSKIEWRYADGKLVAFIIRMSAQDPDDYEKSFENLVVLRTDSSKLEGTCWIGSVDAKKVRNANEEARKIADDLSKPCL